MLKPSLPCVSEHVKLLFRLYGRVLFPLNRPTTIGRLFVYTPPSRKIYAARFCSAVGIHRTALQTTRKHIAPHVSRLTSLFPQTKLAKRQRKNPPEQCSWRGGVVCLCRRMCFENANIIPKATRLCKQKKQLARKSASEPSGESLRRHVLRRAPSLPSPSCPPSPAMLHNFMAAPESVSFTKRASPKTRIPHKNPQKEVICHHGSASQKRRQRTFQPHVCALPGNSPHASHSLSATLTLRFAHLHSQSRRDSLAISPMLKTDAARMSKQLRERVILTLPRLSPPPRLNAFLKQLLPG